MMVYCHKGSLQLDLSWIPKDDNDHGWRIQILDGGTYYKVEDGIIAKFSYLEKDTVIEVTEEAGIL